MKKIEARLIESNLTHQIRHTVLWPHKKQERCSIHEDLLEETFHVGVFSDNELVSIGTFIKTDNEFFEKKNQQYRLRAMGTSKEYRKKSMGKELILFAKNILIKKNVKILWCDARKEAIDFYQKLGFKTNGNYYKIPVIGLHKLMYLYL